MIKIRPADDVMFSIHIRAWGAGALFLLLIIVTLLVVQESAWWAFAYILGSPMSLALYLNEKAKKPDLMQ